MQAVLEITLDEDLQVADFENNLNRMFGVDVMQRVIGSVQGTVKFDGLTKTNMNLDGLDKHQRLLDSYRKIHKTRQKYSAG